MAKTPSCPPAAGGKARPIKYIPSTMDISRGNEPAKSRAQTKARSVLREVHDLVKASDSLPGAIQVERFSETRALEILALQNAVDIAASQGNSRAFQSLPRHLRRRAASHNPRRVPKKLRSRAAAEIDPGDKTARIHRKKAKLRARGNLRGLSRTEQLRARQRGKRWLSTHLFHAKRFHMVNLWGFRLPLTPTLKSFRSSYRAARRKAVLHDASYYGTIELEGPRSKIVDTLGRVSAGGTFAGPKYERGTSFAKFNLFHHGAVPLGLIGPAELLWKPAPAAADHEDNIRTVWLRVHPSMIEDTLVAVRAAKAQTADGSTDDGTSLAVRDLRHEIESFEIMGPYAGRIIKRVLSVSKTEDPQSKATVADLLGANPAECPENAIVGVTVNDPRLSFPPERLCQDMVDVGRTSGPRPTSGVASSSIWDYETRKKLATPRFKKSHLDERRSKVGIPGTRLTPTAEDDRVPVMIIRRSVQSRAPERHADSFQGFTLLFPRGWAMAFLPSFVHCGVRVGGLSERCVQHREAGIPSFPEHYGASCPAGAAWEAERARSDEERWLRRPPGKRPEYSTLGNMSPFKPDWQSVLSTSTSTSTNEVPQLADSSRTDLWQFNPTFGSSLQLLRARSDVSGGLVEACNHLRQRRGLPPISAEAGTGLLRSALCHVEINVLGRGSPSDMASVFHLDIQERQKWLQALETDLHEDVTSGQNSAMLQMGEAHTASRTIGFVSSGNISLTRGRGHGLATITLESYLEALAVAESSCRPDMIVCKVKNRDGLVYRLATLTLVQ